MSLEMLWYSGTAGADARLDRRRDTLSVLDHAEGFRGGGYYIDRLAYGTTSSLVPLRVLLRLRVERSAGVRVDLGAARDFDAAAARDAPSGKGKEAKGFAV